MKLPIKISLALVIAFMAITCPISCKRGDSKSSTSKQVEVPSVVDMVYPHLDTENSRWFFFSSASRPFGMVNLSPDTEINGAWGSGYRYKTDTIKGFSHIHAWQMSGLSVMPITFDTEEKQQLFSDHFSKFDHDKEKVSPGYHYVELERYNIVSELTSTKRVGFHKYTFPSNEKAMLIKLNGILGPCKNAEGTLIQENENTLTGSFVMEPTQRRPKPFKVFFSILFNAPISTVNKDDPSGNFLIDLSGPKEEVLMKVGISYTSVKNAQRNITEELDHWDFDRVVNESKTEWNQLLSRIEVKGGPTKAKQRFYTDLWHALQGRRIISDALGTYPDNTGETFRIGQIPLDESGNPKFNHYNSDSFWGAQWTLNTLWGLVYPDIMEDFAHSLMQYYKDGGMVPRGPSGGNYTYVMTGASTTPFLVSAIQKGIVKDNWDSIYLALKKNHSQKGIMAKAGYEHHTFVGGGIKYYEDNGYVPFPLPEGEFGIHQDGAGQTLEYAYQDWTLAQLAKRIGKKKDYEYFLHRSNNYKNLFNPDLGWMVPRNKNGEWKPNFSASEYENGFVESNSAQSTWFVPHDLEGLAQLMGGKQKAAEKLNLQFKEAQKLKFTSGSSHETELHPEFRRIPINYGNQPSIQTAFIFNYLGRPDLTQYWSRKVVDKAFSGLSPKTGYSGDEDQGLMGSLNVLLKIGLFQMNGGTEENPSYQVGSPIFDEITIKMHPGHYGSEPLKIKASGASSGKVYVEEVTFNGIPIEDFNITHDNLVKGGELVLKMIEQPRNLP